MVMNVNPLRRVSYARAIGFSSAQNHGMGLYRLAYGSESTHLSTMPNGQLANQSLSPRHTPLMATAFGAAEREDAPITVPQDSFVSEYIPMRRWRMAYGYGDMSSHPTTCSSDNRNTNEIQFFTQVYVDVPSLLL